MSVAASSGLLAQSLAAAPNRAEPDWLQAQRRAAALSLRSSGLPTVRDEAWRFTSTKALQERNWRLAEGAPGTGQGVTDRVRREPLVESGWQVHTVDGVMMTPTLPPPTGVVVESIAALLRTQPRRLEAHFGRLLGAEHFAALNALCCEDGVYIEVLPGAKVELPIVVEHCSTLADTASLSYPRLLLVAGEGSCCRVIESFAAAAVGVHLDNAVAELFLQASAQLEHVRIVEGAPTSFHIGAVAVQQQGGSRYTSRVFTFGGALSRLDLLVELQGAAADCVLDGVYHASVGEHVDHHTRIDHQAPGCSSAEHYRGVVDAGGKAVFDGMVIVRRDAQQTKAQQQNHNLLLADNAVVHTKPHLEIDADDVQCSHGATVGSLDEAALFYLQSRGIDRPTCRVMLTDAFAQAHFEAIELPELRRRLVDLWRARLAGGEAPDRAPGAAGSPS